MNRKLIRNLLLGLGILVVLLCTTTLIIASIWPTINRVETGKTLQYPDLRPKTYQLGYDRVFGEAVGAAEEQPLWEIVEKDPVGGQIKARTTMEVTGWTHEVTIRVEKKNEFVSRVHVLSQGEDAPGDLGQNARNIRGYLTALDARLGASAVD